MKIGFYADSFDPFNASHLEVISKAFVSEQLDEMRLMIIGRPSCANFAHRFNMAQAGLSIFNESVFTSKAPIEHLCDADAYLKLFQPNAEAVLILSNIAYLDDLPEQGMSSVVITPSGEDSKFCRAAIKHNWSTVAVIPKAVRDYIDQHKLYRCDNCPPVL
jgi:nicotinic acid mononucleotide adenylyltransferase